MQATRIATMMVLGALAALALATATATATVPPKRCGKIEVSGNAYKVSTHRLECDFARKWSRRYLKDRDHPSGWTCASYSPEESRIAFSCRKGNTTYYAVRK
jgi:hypothetical protein